ncbi:hypothetical protein BDR04DRAFT_358655 [Suillus decipiens]|nr:hypothetical protein BDR04DRAFT_358655 [Suillus decipiens]
MIASRDNPPFQCPLDSRTCRDTDHLRVNVVNARILGKDIDEIIPFFWPKSGLANTVTFLTNEVSQTQRVFKPPSASSATKSFLFFSVHQTDITEYLARDFLNRYCYWLAPSELDELDGTGRNRHCERPTPSDHDKSAIRLIIFKPTEKTHHEWVQNTTV